MSTLKKLLALTLALAMVLSVSVFAGNYSEDTYADAAEIDEACEEAIEVLYALDIMKGDGTNLNPNDPIKRAEMVKMIYVILNKGNDDLAKNWKGNSMFADIKADDWYAGYVNYAGATKLVQGYNGNFDAEAPLTTAQAAKMILTAIGYSAEGRGYVGANWEANVLSDAALLGLLNGYDAPINGYAPRQWVAKMLYNAFTAKTYKSMAAIPGNGLLTSTGGMVVDTIEFAEKYLGVKIATGVAAATKTVVLDGVASNNGVAFIDADGVEIFDLSNTGLKAADLGQEYTVVYKTATNKALSVRNTGASVVVEVEGETIPAKKLVYGTGALKGDSAEAKNHYEFTIGGTEFAVDAQVKVLTNADAYKAAKVEATTAAGVKAIEDARDAAKNTNNLVKVIDKDNDGSIDYVVKTDSFYAAVTKVNTYSYADYVWLQKAGASVATKYYVEDSLTFDDELVAGNVVKVTPNMDSKMYDLEVLGGETEVTRTKLKSGVYTINENEYRIAKGNLGVNAPAKKSLDIVVDDDLLVFADLHVTYLNSLDELNGMLAVVTDVEDHFVVDRVGGYNAVKVLTIDGTEAWIQYKDQAATEAELEALIGHLYFLDVEDEIAELTAYNVAALDPALNPDVAVVEDPITAAINAKADEVTLRKNTASKLMYVDMEAEFFLATTVKGKTVYSVGTVADLGLGKDTAKVEGFFTEVDGWTTLVAGLINATPDTTSTPDTNAGYVLATSEVYAVEVGTKTLYYVDVLLTDNTADTIQVAADEVVVIDELYAYSETEGVYTLTEVAFTGEYRDNKDADATSKDSFTFGKNDRYEIENVTGDTLQVVLNKDARYDIWTPDAKKGADILVKKVTWSADSDENETRAKTDVSFEFVTELDEFAINGTRVEGGYTYYTDFSGIFVDGENYDRTYTLLFVEIYEIEDLVYADKD